MLDDPSSLNNRNLLIDSNLLLLRIVGLFDIRLIGHKRLEGFSLEDFGRISRFIARGKGLITTPGILTETSNLAGQMIDDRRREGLFRDFAATIKKLDEHHAKATDVCETAVFARFGLTDAVIARVAREDTAVITVDHALYGYLLRQGVDAVNFNHFRD